MSYDLDDRLRRLDELAALEPGWDGDGSLPPHPDVLDEVRAVLPLLDRHVPFAPDVAGGALGVGFEWKTGDIAHHATIEVRPSSGGLGMFLMRWDRYVPLMAPLELHEDVPYDRQAFVRFVRTGTTKVTGRQHGDRHAMRPPTGQAS